MSEDRYPRRAQRPPHRMPRYRDLSESPSEQRRNGEQPPSAETPYQQQPPHMGVREERPQNAPYAKGAPFPGTFLDDKPQLVNPAYPAVPAPMGRLESPDDVVELVDLERYGVAATGWKPFWHWFAGIFRHDRAWWRRQIPFLMVAALLVVAAVFIALDHWRRGILILGTTALFTAALRAFLPPEYVEMLEVRSRHFDVLFLLTVGSILLFLVITVPA